MFGTLKQKARGWGPQRGLLTWCQGAHLQQPVAGLPEKPPEAGSLSLNLWACRRECGRPSISPQGCASQVTRLK